MRLYDQMTEDWKPLDHLGFSAYEADRSGKVRNRSNKKICFEMKAKDHRYINLNLKRDGGIRHSQVKLDELIIKTFVGPAPDPNSEVIHVNGNLEDSHIDNLRWGTKQEKRDIETEIYRKDDYVATITLPNEEWRDCSVMELPDYLASSLGRIYSMKRGAVLAGHVRPDGYMRVALEKGSSMLIHKMVCHTFHGPPTSPTDTVDHIDRNKSNNAPSNLRWLSRSDQNRNKDAFNFVPTIVHMRNNRLIQVYEEEDALEVFEAESLIIPETGILFEDDLWMYDNLVKEDFEGEIWTSLNIDGSIVEVSNLGRVNSRYGKTFGTTNNTGYKSVKVSDKSYLVHRLVVMAFREDIPPDMVVNHIDNYKLNNQLNNLEVVTKSANTIHGIKLGTKLTKPVKQLSLTGEVIATFPSIKEASEATSVSYSGISKAARGNQETAGKFRWQYV